MDETKLIKLLRKIKNKNTINNLKEKIEINIIKYFELKEEEKKIKLSKNKKIINLNLRKLDNKIKTDFKILELIED